MRAFYFTAGVTQTMVRPLSGPNGPAHRNAETVDTVQSQTVCANNADEARKRFEAWVCAKPEGSGMVDVVVRKVVAAEFIGQLLSESGPGELDWAEVSKQVETAAETNVADDFEQGYWVDVNQFVRPGWQGADVESLRRDLPDDVRSGLNWSPDKKFFYIVIALSPPPPPPTDPLDEPEAGEGDQGTAQDGDADAEGEGALDPAVAALPELRDREAVALVEARNSVVAAWLWRRYAATTKLAQNDIQIESWCYALGFEQADS
jgi:hypothetical protein